MESGIHWSALDVTDGQQDLTGAERLRAALAWAALRCEQGYEAAYVGRDLRGVLAADDAATADV